MDEDIELVEKKPFIAEAGKSHVPPRNTRSSAVESKIKFISYTAIGLLGCFLLYYQYALSGVPPQETAKESDNSDNNAAINPISSGTKDGYDSSRKKIGVSLPPMLDYINVTASKMFPDKLPDCLYLLRQQPIDPQDKDQRITYFIEQSMNMYWKHDKSFRKHHLHYDMPLLDDATDALNQQAPVAATVLEPDKQKTNDTKHAILHQRIYEAGGSLPFLINWRPSLPTTKTTSNSCPSSHPHGFPIFQRALSADCSDYQNDNIAFQYWTIPTAPILKSKYENDSEIPAIDSNQMGNRDSLLQAVVVATTSTPTTYGDDDHDADTEESIALRREIQKLRQKSKTELADKLVCKYFARTYDDAMFHNKLQRQIYSRPNGCYFCIQFLVMKKRSQRAV